MPKTIRTSKPTAVERELALRLAGLLWRLRRATTIETGLFETQAEHLSKLTKERPLLQSRGGLFLRTWRN